MQNKYIKIQIFVLYLSCCGKKYKTSKDSKTGLRTAKKKPYSAI